MNQRTGDGSTAPPDAILRPEGSVNGLCDRKSASFEKRVGPDAAGARQICRVAGCGLRGPPPQLVWKDGMGITAGKDDPGIGTEALGALNIRERLCASERDILRRRVSAAVHERERADSDAWKEIKANGRPAAPR
jgi:hypothetical protein